MSVKADPLNLADFEFDIPCDFPNCETAATVVCKGCADPHHYAICAPHLEGRRKWFYEQRAVACSTCFRPWMHFDTHFEVSPL